MLYKLVFVASNEFEEDDMFADVIGSPLALYVGVNVTVGSVMLTEDLTKEQLDYLTDLEQSHKWFSWRVF